MLAVSGFLRVVCVLLLLSYVGDCFGQGGDDGYAEKRLNQLYFDFLQHFDLHSLNEYQAHLEAAVVNSRVSLKTVKQNLSRLEEIHASNKQFDPLIFRTWICEVTLLENSRRMSEAEESRKVYARRLEHDNRWIDLLHFNHAIANNRFSNGILDLGKSLFLHNEALIDAGKFKQPHSASDFTLPCSANSLGVLYKQLGDVDSALIYFQRAYRRAIDNRLDSWIGVVAGNYGGAFLAVGDYERATPLLHFDTKHSLEHKNYESAANAFMLLARVAIAYNGNVLQSYRYLDSAKWSLTLLNVDESYDHQRFLQEENVVRTLIYVKQGAKDSALRASINIYEQSLELLYESRRNLASVANQRYYIEDQTMQKWNLEEEYEERTNIAWGFVALLVVSGLGIMFLIRLNRKLHVANAAIEQQAERLESLNEQKGKLFQIVAHDLRSPIANLQAILGLSKSSLINENEFLAYRDEISYSLSGLLGTMENLLHWAKLGMNQGIVPSLSPVDLRDVIASVLSLVAPQMEAKSLMAQSEHGCHVMVLADRDMLSVVIRNLIGNAIKFSETGGAVYIETYPNTDGNLVICSIRDEGIGIPTEKLTKLFDDDVAVQSTSGTLGEKGTGLGLKICKEFIELMSGSIYVVSQLDKGTTFYFQLPCAR